MPTRRRFLVNCSASMATLALIPASGLVLPPAARREVPDFDRLNYSVFSKQLNTRFRVTALSGGVVELRLLKAPLAPQTPPGRRPPGDAGYEKFSLIFSGPTDTLLASAIHWVEHDDLGRFQLHLGQIGVPDKEGARYEAVFSLPAGTGTTLSGST